MIVSGGTDSFLGKIVTRPLRLVSLSFWIGILFCLFGVFEKKNSFIFNFRGMSPRIDLWKENSNLEKRIR